MYKYFTKGNNIFHTSDNSPTFLAIQSQTTEYSGLSMHNIGKSTTLQQHIGLNKAEISMQFKLKLVVLSVYNLVWSKVVLKQHLQHSLLDRQTHSNVYI